LHWASSLAQSAIEELASQPQHWQSLSLASPTRPTPQQDAWRVQLRPAQPRSNSTDQTTSASASIELPMYSSLPAGEGKVGRLRSPEFQIPAELRFAIAGHRGVPDQPAHELNQVRLALSDGTVIAQAFPPRHDRAHWIHWDLAQWSGQSGYLELQDGDPGNAYAWLAVGGFDPPVVEVTGQAPIELMEQVQRVVALARQYRLRDLADPLENLERQEGWPAQARLSLIGTVAQLRGEPFVAAVADHFLQADVDQDLQSQLALRLRDWQWDRLQAPEDDTAVDAVPHDAGHVDAGLYLSDLLIRLSGRQQRYLVAAALTEPRAFEAVLTWAESGRLSAECFLDEAIQQQLELANRPAWSQRVAALVDSLPTTDAAWRQRVVTSEQQFAPWLQRLQAGDRVPRSEVPGGDAVDTASDNEPSVRHDGDLKDWRRIGQQVFRRDCANCHQMAGDGQVVGPQLDGIHRRGLERVLEDVLLPNQNVDHAFRSQLFLMEDGQVLVGLVQEEDDTAVRLTDQQGKPLSLAVQEIEQRRVTTQSLMPADVAHQYSDATLFALIVYLMAQD